MWPPKDVSFRLGWLGWDVRFMCGLFGELTHALQSIALSFFIIVFSTLAVWQPGQSLNSCVLLEFFLANHFLGEYTKMTID